jgi:hypothetical protein
MGWKDDPVEGASATALTPGPGWTLDPVTMYEHEELVKPPRGHGPIGKRPRTFRQKAVRAVKNADKVAKETLLGIPNAARRSALGAVGDITMFPFDVITSGSNFIRGGGFSGYESAWDALNPMAEWRPTTTAPMLELPSDTFEREILNKVTTPSPSGPAQVAEWINRALISGKITPKIRSGTPTAPNPKGLSSIPEEIIAEGRKHDVPVYADDVIRSPFLKRIGVTAESMGEFGTGAGRRIQHDLADLAARRVTESRSVDGVDDLSVEVQKGLRRKLQALKRVKEQLYKRASERLDPVGTVGVGGFNRRFAEIRNEIDRLGPTVTNPDLRKMLDELYTGKPRGNFSTMMALSDELGSRISGYYKGQNATIGKRGVGYLRDLKDQLDQDIAAFADEFGGPEGSRAFKQADEFYKKHLVPFKEPGFRDLVRTGEPEKAWKYLTGQGTIPSRSQRMFNSLDEKGRATVRYGLLKEAYTNARSPQGNFSPAKFATYLDENEAAVKQFFKGAELAEIQGFKNLMRQVERAGAYAENPPTGQRLLLPLLFGSGMYSVKVPAMAVSAGLGTRILFQTDRGRDLLVQLAKAKPGSREAYATANSVARYLTSAVRERAQMGHPDTADINETIEEAATLGGYDGGQ